MIVPGIWNSGPDHWQSRWQAERAADGTDPDADTGLVAHTGLVVRIEPTCWSDPDPTDWSAAISRAVRACSAPPVLIAHSLGVLAVAHWLRDTPRPPVAGAFLVAPPDPAEAGFPRAAAGFEAPTARSTAPTRMVVSDDDPYCTAERAIGFAEALGSGVLRIGRAGHVNVDSGVGAWPAGRALLEDFTRTL